MVLPARVIDPAAVWELKLTEPAAPGLKVWLPVKARAFAPAAIIVITFAPADDAMTDPVPSTVRPELDCTAMVPGLFVVVSVPLLMKLLPPLTFIVMFLSELTIVSAAITVSALVVVTRLLPLKFNVNGLANPLFVKVRIPLPVGVRLIEPVAEVTIEALCAPAGPSPVIVKAVFPVLGATLTLVPAAPEASIDEPFCRIKDGVVICKAVPEAIVAV